MRRRTAPRRPARRGWCGSARRSCPAPGTRTSRPDGTCATSAAAARGGRGATGGSRWTTSTSTTVRRGQSRTSPISNVGRRCRLPCAASIISALLSTPITCASGHRSASSAVRLPGPQPRSTTAARIGGADAGDQVDERAAALVGVGQVAVGVPGVGHDRPPRGISRIRALTTSGRSSCEELAAPGYAPAVPRPASLPSTGDGPALLRLHGGPGMSTTCELLGDEADGWRRIRYDPARRWRRRRPTVRSRWRSTSPTRSRCCDDLGVDEAVVLGHSWGGFLAAVLAEGAPGPGARPACSSTRSGIVGDGGYARFEAQMTARTPAGRACTARTSWTSGRWPARAPRTTPLESLRLVVAGVLRRPATAPADARRPPARVRRYSQTLEDVVALLSTGEPPGPCRGVTADRWR